MLCGTICRGSAAEGRGLIECENLAQITIGTSGDRGHCKNRCGTHPFEDVDGLEHEIFSAGARSLPDTTQYKLKCGCNPCTHPDSLNTASSISHSILYGPAPPSSCGTTWSLMTVQRP